MTYRVALNGAPNNGKTWKSLNEARERARAMWEEYHDEDSGSNAAVIDNDNNVVWFINEKGEIK